MADETRTTATLNIEAGAIVRRAFRGQLERIKFLGHPISWHEDKGWIESHFTIRGPINTLRSISKWVEEIDRD